MRKVSVFVDTNIFVYAFADGESEKREMAIKLLADLGKKVVVSTQVIHEFFWIMTRKAKMPLEQARQLAEDLNSGKTVQIKPGMSLDAIDLSIATGYTIWDTLMIQAAIVGGCETLYSEDLSHGQHVKGLQIKNPFIEP